MVRASHCLNLGLKVEEFLSPTFAFSSS
jgi:hypothetical protein